MSSVRSPSPERISEIIRKHAHDVRNGLNSLDLQAMLLAEVIESPEARQTLERMRAQLKKLESAVKSLSIKFVEPQISRTAARDLMAVWRHHGASISPPPEIDWSDALGTEMIDVDLKAISVVLSELVTNAAVGRRKLNGSARCENRHVVYELRQPAESSDERFQSADKTAADADDLRFLVELSGGKFARAISPSTGELVTTLSFAVA